MSELGHTKGPWRSVYLPGSNQRCASVESLSEDVYIFLNVARADDTDATIERWKYDALLIAAAPDLLEAAKIAVNYMENENCDRYAIDPLRAAISKATNQ